MNYYQKWFWMFFRCMNSCFYYHLDNRSYNLFYRIASESLIRAHIIIVGFTYYYFFFFLFRKLECCSFCGSCYHRIMVDLIQTDNASIFLSSIISCQEWNQLSFPFRNHDELNERLLMKREAKRKATEMQLTLFEIRKCHSATIMRNLFEFLLFILIRCE